MAAKLRGGAVRQAPKPAKRGGGAAGFTSCARPGIMPSRWLRRLDHAGLFHGFIQSVPGCFSGPRAPQTVASEIDAVGVVHDAVEDGVGVGRVSDELVPFVDWDLTRDDG
jgi:hypothetical protein